MKCCDECKDYLKIPKSAISEGDEVKVKQNFPFLCKRNNERSSFWHDDHKPVHTVISVKDYQSELISSKKLIPKFIDEYSFYRHVEIVINGNFSIDKFSLQVRCGTQSSNKIQILEEYYGEPDAASAPGSYYTVSNNQIIICTKHFSLFFIDAALPRKKKLYEKVNRTRNYEQLKQWILKHPDACKLRTVELVMHVYFAQLNSDRTKPKRRRTEKSKISLLIYLRDEAHEKYTESTENTEGQFNTISTPYKVLVPFGSPLPNPPEIIRKQSTFLCNAVFNKEKWKEWICDSVSFFRSSLINFTRYVNSDID